MKTRSCWLTWAILFELVVSALNIVPISNMTVAWLWICWCNSSGSFAINGANSQIELTSRFFIPGNDFITLMRPRGVDCFSRSKLFRFSSLKFYGKCRAGKTPFFCFVSFFYFRNQKVTFFLSFVKRNLVGKMKSKKVKKKSNKRKMRSDPVTERLR